MSVSNDESAKVWTYDGELLYSLLGHSGFIFCVKVLTNGDIVTGSDDRSIKIWRG